jgi:hypothetical protein
VTFFAHFYKAVTYGSNIGTMAVFSRICMTATGIVSKTLNGVENTTKEKQGAMHIHIME